MTGHCKFEIKNKKEEDLYFYIPNILQELNDNNNEKTFSFIVELNKLKYNLFDYYIYGYHNILKELIKKHKFDINTINNANILTGFTFLMYAVQNHDVDLELINLLIDNGANVNYAAKNGKTILMYAIENKSNLNLLKLLIENGADINTVDKKGKNILMYSIENNNKIELVKFLIEKTANINTFDKEGKNILMYAIENKNIIELLKFLIDNGANINHTDIDGKNILSRALNIKPYPSLELIDNLLKLGARVNAEDSNGCGSLINAIKNKLDISYIKLLIDYGADVNADDGDDDGGNVLDYADAYYEKHVQHDEIIKLIKDKIATTKSIATTLINTTPINTISIPVPRPRNTINGIEHGYGTKTNNIEQPSGGYLSKYNRNLNDKSSIKLKTKVKNKNKYKLKSNYKRKLHKTQKHKY